MAQPYNYSIQTPNIGEQFAQGYNQMAAFGAAQQAAEQRKQQQEQAAATSSKMGLANRTPNVASSNPDNPYPLFSIVTYNVPAAVG